MCVSSAPFLFLLVLLALYARCECQSPSTSAFLSPSGVGVKWRYWVEDGNVNINDLAADIQAISAVGSYGVELLSYQSYGYPVIGEDVGVSGYGSALYKQFVESAASLAVQHNLTVDVSAGPSQGAGVPAQNPDAPGFNTELAFGWTLVKANTGLQQTLPPPLIIPLEKYGGAVAPVFNVTTARLEAVILAALAPSANVSLATIQLDFTTITDVSANVSNGILSLAPVTSDSVVVAFYSRRNGYQEAYGSQFNASLPASWGAFVVDHFSADGANTIDCFTAAYLFNPPSAALMSAARLIWEDSMEFRAQLYWTPAFMQRFKQQHNYSAIVGLPAFYLRDGAAFAGINLPPQVFAFSDSDLNHRFFFDYLDTLSVLYMEYIATRNRNAAALGYRLSLQPAYGFPLDVAAAAGMVSVPEIETLAFTTVDIVRQASGGAHLGGAKILSCEFGAEQVKAYAQPMSEIVQLSNVQFAGGVNQLVFHGFPHNGPLALTTWPGFTPFAFVYSEMHGPRQPGWHQYNGYLAHLTRAQYVLQKGAVAKVDLAVYRHDFNVAQTPLFASNVLQLAGYSYEYLSPYNLQLPLAAVVHNRLGAFDSAPAYKALILSNQTVILLSAASKLLQLAQAGLPILIVGNLPNNIPGYEPSTASKDAVVSIMNQMLQIPNVRQVVSYDALPAALSAMGVRPAAALVGGSSTDEVYSVRRCESVANSHTDYYWLYNAGNVAVNVTINFETVAVTSVPFYFNSWTGAIRSVIATSYPQPGMVQLAGLYLYPQQTVIFAFTNATNFEGMAVADAITNAVPISQYSVAAATAYANSQAKTSSSTVGGWQLSMTAYNAPSDLNVYSSVLSNIGPISLGDTLIYFNSIAILAGNTSGVALYQTSFLFNYDPSSVVAVLDVSAAVGTVFHTATVSLNQHTIALAIDPATQLVELPASILIQGNNSLSIQIATTLLNTLNTVAPTSILTLGGNRLSGLPFVPPSTTNGIQGKIQIVTFSGSTGLPGSTTTMTPTKPTTAKPTSSAALSPQPALTLLVLLVTAGSCLLSAYNAIVLVAE